MPSCVGCERFNICVSNRKLAIIRDIPILKVKRCEGSSVRGTRPITVLFEKYQVFDFHILSKSIDIVKFLKVLVCIKTPCPFKSKFISRGIWQTFINLPSVANSELGQSKL